jgi:hypothetical protein
MRYVYIQSESELWTVGFYDPSGEWHSESDHSSTRDAAARVAYLNGGYRYEET